MNLNDLLRGGAIGSLLSGGALILSQSLGGGSDPLPSALAVCQHPDVSIARYTFADDQAYAGELREYDSMGNLVRKLYLTYSGGDTVSVEDHTGRIEPGLINPQLLDCLTKKAVETPIE